MRVRATKRDLDELFADGPVSVGAMLNLLHDVEHKDQDEIAFANSLVPGAGDYLNRGWLRLFIKADISDDDAKQEVSRQKALVKRLCALFPAVLRYLRLDEKKHALNVLNMVSDCASDYAVILESGRRTANRKKTIAKIDKLHSKIVEVNELLDDPDSPYSYDFESIYKAYKKHLHGDETEVRPFWQLQNDLKFLSHFLSFNLYRAHHESDFIRPRDNQAKTHIVDCAYSLSLGWGGPQLVTMPGSDFSAMCSVIFEIATGIADESLAGAINRYARSQERAEVDEHEIEYGPARERERDDDNFYDVKKAALKFQSEIEDLKVSINDSSMSVESRILAGCLLAEAIEKAERNDKAHGPFIMWASQMKIDWDGKMREHEDHEARLLQLAINLGNRQRAPRTPS